MIPHNRPTLSQQDSDAMAKVIASGYVAQGKQVAAFERRMADYVGLKYGCALSSGTASLFVALKVAGVQTGDKVIIPTYVCSALLNAIYMAGAHPVLLDVDRNNYNIIWNQVLDAMDEHTKSVIAPHIHGVPAYVDKNSLPKGVTLIEDCATAVNSYVEYDGERKHVGHIGHMAVFSFYATKYFTCGQGGMICTDDEELYNRIVDYRDFDCCETYIPRFNLQMTDILAAMGLSQMERLQEFATRRNEIAAAYRDVCDQKGWKYQGCQQGGVNVNFKRNYRPFANQYRYIVKFDNEAKRDDLMKILEQNDIRCIIPIERYELLHNYLHLDAKRFPNAEEIASCTLSLPIYPSLTNEELERITNILRTF